MAKNILKLTDLGLQSANNASAGGLLVDLLRFKVGTSRTQALATDTDIKGTEVHTDSITFVEVLDEHSVRFRFDIPTNVAPVEGVDINEVAVFMDGNIMFGRCVLLKTFHINHKEGISIDCVLTTTECDVSVLNVVIGDYVSVPSTPFIYRLPYPSQAEHNSVNVLDMMQNTDNTESAGQAVRFGQGSLHWAFQGHDRIFSNHPDEDNTRSEFKAASTVQTHNIANGDQFIVQVITGPGIGESRKFKYNGTKAAFVESDGQPFSTFSTQSIISIWRKIGGSLTLSGNLPSTEGVPPDWVLHRGPDSGPIWAPIAVGGRNVNTLYRAPGRLRIEALSDTGDGQQFRYTLVGAAVKNANHIIAALGSVSQHRNAFEIQANELEFAESIPASVPIDIRSMTKEPSSGHYVKILTDAFVADGNARRFKISQPIEGPQYALVYLRGGLQGLAAYIYDASSQEIVFTETPTIGLEVEINSLAMEEDEGWSCEPSTMTIYTTGDTHFMELPVVPQGIENVFISINGIHLHQTIFSLADNKIILGSPIPGNRMVEVMVIHNWRAEGTPETNITGMVVDAYITHKSLNLIRHGASPVRLPIPGINITAGDGIKVKGVHPNYKVSSTIAEKLKIGTMTPFSSSSVEEDAEEIIFTKRFDAKQDGVLLVTADFSAILGPGFVTPDGLELIQFVVGSRTISSQEPEYGRQIKGTDVAGFTSLVGETEGKRNAYANASMTQVINVVADNIPSGVIDVVARMRVRNANISQYGSTLSLNINVISFPRLL
jgi:hypothetical protein